MPSNHYGNPRSSHYVVDQDWKGDPASHDGVRHDQKGDYSPDNPDDGKYTIWGTPKVDANPKQAETHYRAQRRPVTNIPTEKPERWWSSLGKADEDLYEAVIELTGALLDRAVSGPEFDEALLEVSQTWGVPLVDVMTAVDELLEETEALQSLRPQSHTTRLRIRSDVPAYIRRTDKFIHNPALDYGGDQDGIEDEYTVDRTHDSHTVSFRDDSNGYPANIGDNESRTERHKRPASGRSAASKPRVSVGECYRRLFG